MADLAKLRHSIKKTLKRGDRLSGSRAAKALNLKVPLAFPATAHLSSSEAQAEGY